MENLPFVKETSRVPLKWPSSPYLADHRFLGKAVLPAVESMELLATAVKSVHPGKTAAFLSSIELKRFLPIDGGARIVFAEIQLMENGSLRALLSSEIKSRTGAVTRKMEHVSLQFDDRLPSGSIVPLDVAAGLLGIAGRVDRSKLYGEMVPFGPAYHNAEKVFITEEGAAVYISPAPAPDEERLLGSPFTLDAAFHGACAWGQSVLQFVGFPVSLKERSVLVPTRSGDHHFARILPTTRGLDHFTADILIYGMDGTLHESVRGLVMKDISGGKLAPPAWIASRSGPGPIEGLEHACDALAVIELDSIPDFAHETFTMRERDRFRSMGPKRRQSYTGARIASKRLYRKLQGSDAALPAHLVETVNEKSEKPGLFCLPGLLSDPGSDPVNVSVSHDARFAVAAASHNRIGIDVERFHERLVTTRKFYTKDQENQIIRDYKPGETHALIRIWTIKEAVAKALAMTLADSWKQTVVTVIGESESVLFINDKEAIALHCTVDDHLFTLIIIGDGE